MKYHVGRDGSPKPCHAQGACPLGGNEVHFKASSVQEATRKADLINAQSYSSRGASKPNKSNKYTITYLDQNGNSQKYSMEASDPFDADSRFAKMAEDSGWTPVGVDAQ